jgi:hypothetical protein
MFAATLTSLLSGWWAATPAGAAPAPLGAVPSTQGSPVGVVDVYLDGTLILNTGGSDPSTPLLSVSAGTHRVEVRRAAQPSTSPPLLSSDIEVRVGHHKSAAVHLEPDGKAEISVSPDEGGAVPVPPRVVVRHPTAAPPTDADVHDSPPPQAPATSAPTQSDAPAGTQHVSVRQAGTRHASSHHIAHASAVDPSVRWIRSSANASPSGTSTATPDALSETYAFAPADASPYPGGTAGISSLSHSGIAAAAAFINDHLIVLDILGVAALLYLSLSRDKRRA